LNFFSLNISAHTPEKKENTCDHIYIFNVNNWKNPQKRINRILQQTGKFKNDRFLCERCAANQIAVLFSKLDDLEKEVEKDKPREENGELPLLKNEQNVPINLSEESPVRKKEIHIHMPDIKSKKK
jgi:hypothetical protein